jgi:hypothetical protein
MVAIIVSLPAFAPLGANAATLWLPEPLTVKFDGLASPLSVQANVKGKLAAELPFAVRLIDPLIPTTPPVAAGDCDAHVGGVFFTTVHVCVALLEPLLVVATRVLLPEFSCDDKIALVFAAPEIADPLRAQVVEQLASLGVTLKVVLVAAAAATR